MTGGRLFWQALVIFGVFLIHLERGECSQEVMHNITKGFTKVLEECKKQENVGDHIMNDFFNFWHEQYELVNREMGCILMCMASKLELVDADMKMHHGNAHEFAKVHGADDELAKQLVTMVHECEKANEGTTDHCVRALETTKCFRTKIHGLKWAPSMRVVMEEVMTAL